MPDRATVTHALELLGLTLLDIDIIKTAMGDAMDHLEEEASLFDDAEDFTAAKEMRREVARYAAVAERIAEIA